MRSYLLAVVTYLIGVLFISTDTPESPVQEVTLRSATALTPKLYTKMALFTGKGAIVAK